MSEDLDLLRRAVEEPVGQMILAEVASPAHSQELARQIREWVEPPRQLAEFGFNANRDNASVLWERCCDAVGSWGEDNPGLLLVRDDSPALVRISHGASDKPTSIGFWRTMNQLREKWDALPAQTIFLVTHEQYFFLTTEADHFKRWIPLKLHVPGPQEVAPRRFIATPSRASDELLTASLLLDDLEDQKAAQQNWTAYLERLRYACERGESAQTLARRYYLPLMAAGITLQKWDEAANYNRLISQVSLSKSQQLRWLRLRSRLEEAQGNITEAIATAEERLKLSQELDQERAREVKKQQTYEPSRNTISAVLDLYFLHDNQKNFDEAERWLRQGLDIAPDEIVYLGNYALFLKDVRRDYEKADEFFRRAIEINPKHPANLANYARFLSDIWQDYDRAEEFFQRSIKSAPDNPQIIGNYALFLANVRQDYQKAEDLFCRSIAIDPTRAEVLGGYAVLLRDFRQDYSKAEELYLRALQADPKDAITLTNYALLLCLNRQDYGKAASYFRRALEAAPDNPQYAINYAALLLSQGKKDEGKAILERAAAMSDLSDAQQVGIAFHRYIHFPEEVPSPLKELKRLLKSGKRAKGWTFELNIERARLDNHPHMALLKALAAVISEDKTLVSLNPFREWRIA